jgi:uncharacterized membrane protein
MSAVLIVGTAAAGLTVALGTLLALTGASPIQADPTPVLDALSAGGAVAIVAVGLLALALVPVAQLGVAVVAFARSGERRHALVALTVLALLVAGLIGSAAARVGG